MHGLNLHVSKDGRCPRIVKSFSKVVMILEQWLVLPLVIQEQRLDSLGWKIDMIKADHVLAILVTHW